VSREQQWLTTSKPHNLAWVVLPTASERKSLLLGCAFARACWSELAAEALRQVVAAAELYADGMISDSEWGIHARALRGLDRSRNTSVEDQAVRLVERLAEGHQRRVVDEVVQVIRDKTGRLNLCAAVRDIFGNPFRPVAFDAAWLTSTAVAIARGMYESRDFTAMPILADALQDAGCESEDVLNHCRDEKQTHVRGCWVVDLVLGK
jgi:hypothetical protein